MKTQAHLGLRSVLHCDDCPPCTNVAAVPENRPPVPVKAPAQELRTTRRGIGRACLNKSTNRLASHPIRRAVLTDKSKRALAAGRVEAAVADDVHYGPLTL